MVLLKTIKWLQVLTETRFEKRVVTTTQDKLRVAFSKALAFAAKGNAGVLDWKFFFFFKKNSWD